jgi:GR25 family glycosyltransferase involved in LPS biosynthesis
MFMEQQLNKLSMEFEIINAVEGKTFDFGDLYDEKSWQEHNGKPGTPGEKGCELSHRMALQRMLDEGLDYALILEDDIELDPHFKEILESELRQRESGKNHWDYLSFNYPSVGWKSIHLWLFMFFNMAKTKKTDFGFIAKLPVYFLKFIAISVLYLLEGARENIYAHIFPLGKAAKFHRSLYLAGCYIVTREGVNKLISLNTPLSYTADALPNEAKKQKGLNFMAHVPLVARQKREEFESLLYNEHFGKKVISY